MKQKQTKNDLVLFCLTTVFGKASPQKITHTHKKKVFISSSIFSISHLFVCFLMKLRKAYQE